jgi:NAD(P)-dependent dehydrogenase (short-subunit alcohol dehydrogenase family)
MRVQDRVVVVTGGASGLGRHYCQLLAEEGARVVIADVKYEDACTVADELNGDGADRALACAVDVTSPDDIAAMTQAAVDHFGTIDILVNNAGIYPHKDFLEIDFAAWRSVMSVNLDSVFLTCSSIVPVMREHGGGKIINVSTNLVWVGLSGMVHYIASKAGIVGFTRALAREVGPYGITVNALAPGAVPPPRERMSPESKASIDSVIEYQSVRRPEQPRDLANVVLFLCSADSDFMSGQVITVDGGLAFH